MLESLISTGLDSQFGTAMLDFLISTWLGRRYLVDSVRAPLPQHLLRDLSRQGRIVGVMDDIPIDSVSSFFL